MYGFTFEFFAGYCREHTMEYLWTVQQPYLGRITAVV